MTHVSSSSILARAGTLLLPFALAAGADTSSDPVLAQIGASSYAVYCASCHGLDAKGGGPAAEALVVPPADLTRIAARRDGVFPSSEIARVIDGRFELPAHGSRAMPVWGQRFSEAVPDPGLGEELARGRIISLVEYLRTIQADD